MLHLSILLWLPLVLGLAGLLLPPQGSRLTGLLGPVLTLVLAIAFLVDFQSGRPGLQHVTDDTWISALGVRYQLGISGLNVWLVLLSAVGFSFTAIWSVIAGHDADRPRSYHLWLGIAHTGVLGALLAQDLLLFVGFFDLMLIPFFFLALGWSGLPQAERTAAVTKMVIYTLVGSFLMLVAAVAMGVLATPDGGRVSYSLADIAARGVPDGSQGWIFVCFAAAFLVKMPLFPFQGWLRDGYRSMPLPVLAVFSGVLSKVAAYGFLQIVLPLLPNGVADLRWFVLILAVASILYASAVALTATNARVVLAYSSVAQLGFIVLGIFSLRGDGASGALLQSVNHGLVVLPAFLAVGILSARAGGSEDIRDMGGVAFRAPAFAVLFVVITYAVLAMPGTSNFVGEFLILRGTWEHSIALAAVASIGVALAAVYALRLFIRTMHERVGPKVDDAAPIPRAHLALLAVPVVLIVALAVHPQQTLRAGEVATTRSVLPAAIQVDRAAAARMVAEADAKTREAISARPTTSETGSGR